MNPIPNYDGSCPEPPYNTDTDAVVMLQEDLDAMTAERDALHDLLLTALPYVEDAELLPDFKPGVVKALAGKIRAALSKKNKTETPEGGHG